MGEWATLLINEARKLRHEKGAVFKRGHRIRGPPASLLTPCLILVVPEAYVYVPDPFLQPSSPSLSCPRPTSPSLSCPRPTPTTLESLPLCPRPTPTTLEFLPLLSPTHSTILESLPSRSPPQAQGGAGR